MVDASRLVLPDATNDFEVHPIGTGRKLKRLEDVERTSRLTQAAIQDLTATLTAVEGKALRGARAIEAMAAVCDVETMTQIARHILQIEEEERGMSLAECWAKRAAVRNGSGH